MQYVCHFNDDRLFRDYHMNSHIFFFYLHSINLLFHFHNLMTCEIENSEIIPSSFEMEWPMLLNRNSIGIFEKKKKKT